MTTTAISTQEQFQEQMKARIRAAAGELMPNEMLQEIVKRGIEEAFFKQRVTADSYGRKTEHGTWLAEFLSGELRSQVSTEVNRWLAANPDAIKEVLAEVVRDGIGKAVLEALARKTQYEFEAFASNLASRLRQ